MEVIGEMIDRLISIEMRGGYARGISPKLWEAAYRKVGKPLTFNAAEKLVERVDKGDTVILSAGWVVPPLYPVGEPCGTVGTAALARACYFALQTKAIFLSEKPVLPVWEAVVNSFEQRVVPYKIFEKEPFAISTRLFPIDEEQAKIEAKKVLDELEPAAIITAEKCSRNEKGVWHTGLGNDMGPWTAKIDYLIEEARKRNILTIGIGDLGNEIGMALIHDEAEKLIDEYEPKLKLGTRCKCGCGGSIVGTTLTDCLVFGSASNRGCYGLIGMLSALKDDPQVMHSPEQWYRGYETAVSMGAGDSITGRPALRDDGVPIKCDMHQIELISQFIKAKKFKEPLFEEARRATGW